LEVSFKVDKGEISSMHAELARLGKSALLNSDWQRLGELMNDNHRIQCELAGHGESNERLISAALDAGASGLNLPGPGRAEQLSFSIKAKRAPILKKFCETLELLRFFARPSILA